MGKSYSGGYFYFLDGGSRWDSLISFPKIKISNAKIVPAKLIKKVEPVYPADAAAQHISGTVRVHFVIGGDGAVYNAHAISGDGLSEDPSLLLKGQSQRHLNLPRAADGFVYDAQAA